MPLSTEDQLEILQLLYRYSHALDSGDAGAFAELFAPDGAFVDPDTTAQGHEALRELVREHHRAHPGAAASQHWLQAPVVVGDGERAVVDAYVIVFRPGTDGRGADGLVMGTYHDELRKDALRGWVFERRVVTRPTPRPAAP